MCNFGIFTTLVYSSPGRLRAQWIIRNLSNMCDGLFSTEPCVALVFSELESYSRPCQIFMIENFIHKLVWSRIQGIFRILPNIYHEILYSKPCVWPWHIHKASIFRTLVYSEIKAYPEPCRLSKRNILLRTLCNYSRFRGPIYSKLPHI